MNGNDASQAVTGDNGFKDFFKKWPRFYNFLFAVVGPSLFTGVTSKQFVASLPADAKVLHGGSGPKKISKNCINVDIAQFPGVDVVADLRKLPFEDASFDAATCDQVLEHVPQPWLAAAQLRRVVKPGGKIHIAVPFVFPWHPSPSDFSRWTTQGLSDLFPGCVVIEKGVMAGPFSALNAFVPAFLATVFCFGSRKLQAVLQYVFLVACIPFKLLDVIFARIPGAELAAAGVYIIVEVPR